MATGHGCLHARGWPSGRGAPSPVQGGANGKWSRFRGVPASLLGDAPAVSPAVPPPGEPELPLPPTGVQGGPPRPRQRPEVRQLWSSSGVRPGPGPPASKGTGFLLGMGGRAGAGEQGSGLEGGPCGWRPHRPGDPAARTVPGLAHRHADPQVQGVPPLPQPTGSQSGFHRPWGYKEIHWEQREERARSSRCCCGCRNCASSPGKELPGKAAKPWSQTTLLVLETRPQVPEKSGEPQRRVGVAVVSGRCLAEGVKDALEGSGESSDARPPRQAAWPPAHLGSRRSSCESRESSGGEAVHTKGPGAHGTQMLRGSHVAADGRVEMGHRP